MHKYGKDIVKCSKCGEKGLQRRKSRRGQIEIYISHPVKIQQLDNPFATTFKQCYLGKVVTDSWDFPKTDEGYQIILIQLIEGLETIIRNWNQKSPTTLTKYTKRAEELQKIVNAYQKFKPTMSQMEGLK